MARLSRGFHRLGVLLSAPFVLGAMAITIYALAFSSSGPLIADLNAKPTSLMALWGGPMPTGAKDPRNFFDHSEPVGGVPVLLDDRPIKLHHVTGGVPLQDVHPDQMAESDRLRIQRTIKDILAAERQIGRLFRANESPVLVGDILVYFEKNQPYYPKMGHLKRGIDWQSFWIGLAVMFFGFGLYVLVRAIGWVLAGFMKDSP